jgi:hypothetical protein
MTDELRPNETRDALLRRRLTERAKQLGWKPPEPTSDYATWLLQKLLDMRQLDGLIGPNTMAQALHFAAPPQPALERCFKCGRMMREPGLHTTFEGKACSGFDDVSLDFLERGNKP